MTKSRIFLTLCLAFALGILFAPVLSRATIFMLFALAILFVSLRPNKLNTLIFIGLIVLILGSFRLNIANKEDDLHIFYNQTAEVKGQIIEEPDERADKILVTLGKIIINGKKAEGKILVQISKYPKYDYGSELTIRAKILEPKDFEGFSYKQYLSRFGISAVSYNPKIVSANYNQGNPIKYWSLRVKKKFIEALGKVLPEPENGFLAGILLGQRKAIPQNIIEQFNKTGTSHIIALSGFNITIIINYIGKIFSRFGRRVSFCVSFVLIVFFVVMTGAQASVVRAAIMGILAQLATNVGRVYYAMNALALSGAIMLIENPKLLRFDIGFQLSFLAVLGLVYITPLLETCFPKLPQFLKDYLLPTVAAQIASTPLILLNFERISLIAPIVNLVVLPLVPLAMAVGFATGILALISPFVGQVVGWISWIILHVILKIIAVASSIPFSSITFNHVPKIIPGIVYLTVSLMVVVLNRRRIWNQKPNN